MERLLLPGVAMRRLASRLQLGLARVRGADVSGHLLMLMLAYIFLIGGVLVDLGLRLQAERLLLLLLLVLAQVVRGQLVLPDLHLLGEHLLMVVVSLLLCDSRLSFARFVDLVDLFGG